MSACGLQREPEGEERTEVEAMSDRGSLVRVETGKALGDEWRWSAPWGAWVCGTVMVLRRSDRWIVEFGSPQVDADAVPSVARLLVAAERIAGGAQVAVDAIDHVRPFPRHHPLAGCVGFGSSALGPTEARRFAIDLLRAADEAEAGNAAPGAVAGHTEDAGAGSGDSGGGQ